MSEPEYGDMPEEHDQFGGAMGRSRIGGVGTPLQTASSAADAVSKSTSTAKILVCEECVEYYSHREDWQCCPKCGEEFTEVEKA